MSEIEIYSNIYDGKSSTGKPKKKKSVKKSNHKHLWSPVLIAPYKDRQMVMRGEICEVCGKVEVTGLLSKRTGNNSSTLLTWEEAKELYDWQIIYNYEGW